jgi:hypothetical protein
VTGETWLGNATIQYSTHDNIFRWKVADINRVAAVVQMVTEKDGIFYGLSWAIHALIYRLTPFLLQLPVIPERMELQPVTDNSSFWSHSTLGNDWWYYTYLCCCFQGSILAPTKKGSVLAAGLDNFWYAATRQGEWPFNLFTTVGFSNSPLRRPTSNTGLHIYRERETKDKWLQGPISTNPVSFRSDKSKVNKRLISADSPSGKHAHC